MYKFRILVFKVAYPKTDGTYIKCIWEPRQFNLSPLDQEGTVLRQKLGMCPDQRDTLQQKLMSKIDRDLSKQINPYYDFMQL
jgi:hypothetical protein